MAIDKTPTVLPRRLLNKAQTETAASAVDKDIEIPKESPLFINQRIRDLRDGGNAVEAIRKLAKQDGTVSTAVFNYVQVAMSGFTVKAFDSSTHQFSPEGSILAKSILAAFNTLTDYSVGYSDVQTMDSLIESALREVVLTGGLCGELVLNKARLPSKIQWVPMETVKWISNGDGTKYPAQTGAEEDIALNLATVWVAESHKDTSETYVRSMMEAALNTTFYYAEFIEDMRRAMRRGGHSRLIVKLDAEKVIAAAPNDVRQDAAKLKAFLEVVRTDVEGVVTSMEPEDALVCYDTVNVELLTAENVKADYTDLVTAISGMLATSLKSHPSILGLRLGGSQSLSNTESLIYLKAASAIQRPVEDIMSRSLTLASRLFGSDIYVQFKFNPINIRPDDELEAFKTMKQARVLELLSFGFISDEEAAENLGTGERPPGAPALSGTLFRDNKGGIDAENASPNDDPQGRALQSDQPTNGGGRDNGE